MALTLTTISFSILAHSQGLLLDIPILERTLLVILATSVSTFLAASTVLSQLPAPSARRQFRRQLILANTTYTAFALLTLRTLSLYARLPSGKMRPAEAALALAIGKGLVLVPLVSVACK